MRRFGPSAAALLFLPFVAGCENGIVETETHTTVDAGTGGGDVVVILDGGGEPATPPDGTSSCPQGACNYQSGAGCSGAAPSCIPNFDATTHTAAPACFPAGSGKTGAACTQATDCAPGHICAEKQCRKLCCGGDWTGCDGAGEHCLKKLEYSDPTGGTVDTGAMICYPVGDCDPLVPASCATPGTECLIADATGAVACLSPGAGGSGEPCPCAGGFVCIASSPGATPSCRRLCGAVEGGAPPYCQAGEGVCVHHTRDPAGVGECQPMP